MSLNGWPSLRCCTAAFVACIVLAAQAQQLPDPRLTPGAFADSSTRVVCAPGYARTHWVWHDKAGTLAKCGALRGR
jgi:hypothetical protein